MNWSQVSPDELLLLGAVLKLRLVTSDRLNAIVLDSEPDGVGAMLVGQGVLDGEQLRVLQEADFALSQIQTRIVTRKTESSEIHNEQTVMEGVAATGSEVGSAATIVDDSMQNADTVLQASQAPQATRPAAGSSPTSSLSRGMTDQDATRIRAVVDGFSRDLTGVNMGGYFAHGRLGSGGMGDVYQATQLSLDRQVALKVLPPRIAARGDFLKRFYTEAKILARFNHSNIVQVFDVGEAEGIHFFTMEQVRGQTLKDLIDSGREPSLDVSVNMLKQCLRGLNRALREGIIHRDLKPGNILIDENGEVKIVDFGLAVPLKDGAMRSEGIVGTPIYMSPEQAMGGEVTFHTDMYSLGATFYHMILGQIPYSARDPYDIMRKHTADPVPDPHLVNPDLPAPIRNILMRMMAKKPSERFPSYEALYRELEKFEIEQGYIKSQSDFLADSLLALGDRGIRRVALKVAVMSTLAASLLVLAFGLRSLIDSAGKFHIAETMGDLGTVFLALTYLSIGYVAAARKRYLPVYGDLRMWMNGHIACALLSFVLVMVHSGNFLSFFAGGQEWADFRGTVRTHRVALLPFLNSLIFLLVIVSGLVGRWIWADLLRQVNTDRIRSGKPVLAEDNRLTLTVFAQSVFKYWRILHYPMAVALLVVTVVHVLSIIYWGGI